MTETDETPLKGHESIERWRTGDESFPLSEASDEDMAQALEEHSEATAATVDGILRALRDDETPLTDGEVTRLVEYANALRALGDSLYHRVPDAHRKREAFEDEQ